MALIEIYSNRDLLPKDRHVIWDNEAIFPGIVTALKFGEREHAILKELDNAVVLDANTETILTPFGSAKLWEISTGCKTVLNFIALKDHLGMWERPPVLNITECGANALNVLFRIASEDNPGIIFLLEHIDGLFMCGEHEFLINGIHQREDLNVFGFLN